MLGFGTRVRNIIQNVVRSLKVGDMKVLSSLRFLRV